MNMPTKWKGLEPQVYFVLAALGAWILAGFIGLKLALLCWAVPLAVCGYYRASK